MIVMDSTMPRATLLISLFSSSLGSVHQATNTRGMASPGLARAASWYFMRSVSTVPR